MKSNKEKKRKSHYNENRDSYLSIDGKYYCYKFWDMYTRHIKTERIEIKNDSQKNLYYDHFGMNKQLVEIAREEGEQTGKTPSNSAMNNRKNKIL